MVLLVPPSLYFFPVFRCSRASWSIPLGMAIFGQLVDLVVVAGTGTKRTTVLQLTVQAAL